MSTTDPGSPPVRLSRSLWSNISSASSLKFLSCRAPIGTTSWTSSGSWWTWCASWSLSTTSSSFTGTTPQPPLIRWDSPACEFNFLERSFVSLVERVQAHYDSDTNCANPKMLSQQCSISSVKVSTGWIGEKTRRREFAIAPSIPPSQETFKTVKDLQLQTMITFSSVCYQMIYKRLLLETILFSCLLTWPQVRVATLVTSAVALENTASEVIWYDDILTNVSNESTNWI